MTADQPKPVTSYAPIARIDLAALRHNLQRCRELNPDQPIMPVVKANAYGHGAIEVATTLLNAGAEGVCVARLDEALALRAAGIKGNIVVLEGVYNAAELSQALQHRFSLVLHDAGQIAALPDSMPALQHGRPQTVWLKVETGMHRLGVPLQQAAALAKALQKKSWCSQVGWFTHLACADEAGNAAEQQISELRTLTAQYDGPISVANSAATAAWPTDRWPSENFLRPGIMLYGSSPLLNRTAAELNLLPVMTLETPLLAVKEIPEGATVGYGATWRSNRPTIIGIAAIGYGDGYPRCLSSSDDKPNAEVWIAGQRCPVIGRVSMDKIAIDLTDHQSNLRADDGPVISAGEVVQLWGDKIPVDEVAQRAETISYELLSGVAPRVLRVYQPKKSAPTPLI